MAEEAGLIIQATSMPAPEPVGAEHELAMRETQDPVALESAVKKLKKLGLTEQEARAIAGG